jgi:hypothetical protein
LQYGGLAFTSAGQPGHNGCLYSHIDFLLHSLGRADCVIPRYEKSVSPDKMYGPVQITVVNKTPIMLVAVKLVTDGELLPVPSANIEPHGAVTIDTYVNTVWRFATHHDPLGQSRVLAEILVDRIPDTRHFDVVDCARDRQAKGSVLFEVRKHQYMILALGSCLCMKYLWTDTITTRTISCLMKSSCRSLHVLQQRCHQTGMSSS